MMVRSMEIEEIQQIIEAINELQGDNTVPKNIKIKLQTIAEILKGGDESVSIKVNKALDELEEISDDANIQSYTRTQIWNIVSLLESI
ncbi:UPF0147 family protein [Candidatus Woesearchaeota archaeon]|nr:UPF0147 family protein [Candidatus Woesearchaeota archaeon]